MCELCFILTVISNEMSLCSFTVSVLMLQWHCFSQALSRLCLYSTSPAIMVASPEPIAKGPAGGTGFAGREAGLWGSATVGRMPWEWHFKSSISSEKHCLGRIGVFRPIDQHTCLTQSYFSNFYDLSEFLESFFFFLLVCLFCCCLFWFGLILGFPDWVSLCIVWLYWNSLCRPN